MCMCEASAQNGNWATSLYAVNRAKEPSEETEEKHHGEGRETKEKGAWKSKGKEDFMEKAVNRFKARREVKEDAA